MRKIVAGELPEICFDKDTIEAGQRTIQVAHRFVLKDICLNNDIGIKDVVIVYLRIPGETNIIEAGEKTIQRDYRISVKTLLKNPDLKEKIKIGKVVNVYIKKKPKTEKEVPSITLTQESSVV